MFLSKQESVFPKHENLQRRSRSTLVTRRALFTSLNGIFCFRMNAPRCVGCENCMRSCNDDDSPLSYRMFCLLFFFFFVINSDLFLQKHQTGTRQNPFLRRCSHRCSLREESQDILMKIVAVDLRLKNLHYFCH